MPGKRIGYKRVSTVDQSPERQLDGVPLDKVFVDYATGRTIKRPQLDLLLEYVRDDDIVFVHSLDRMARNLRDLQTIIDGLTSRGVTVHFIQEMLIFTGDEKPMTKLLLAMLGAFAEFEYSLLRERQREGVQLAKKMGKYKGRKSCLNADQIEKLKNELLNTRKSIAKIAKEIGISRTSAYKYLKIAGLEFDRNKFPQKKTETTAPNSQPPQPPP